MTVKLSIVGLPFADNIRWRLLLGLEVSMASSSKPTIALTSSRSISLAVSGSPLRLLTVDCQPS